jgi:hypothetical protein
VLLTALLPMTPNAKVVHLDVKYVHLVDVQNVNIVILGDGMVLANKI